MGICWEGAAQEEFLETYLYAEQTYDIINILSHVYILSMILPRNTVGIFWLTTSRGIFGLGGIQFI